MKKWFITSLIPFLLLTNCYLFDTIGLSIPDTVSGTEAKNQILTSALIGAIASPDNTAIIAVISPQLAKVDEGRYYKKVDVDDCANSALIINLATIDIGGFTCNLEPREYILWWVY
ncbi:TIGR04452 family lipoprotein [Leptospira yasudae]|uniref:TIGR04452 family lipoprotein n=1 Tax=Leptospira yasudae TaxID=2202201 RepID=A0A6N4QHT1_9LEPT|nr:TIGR04452 family lipoprotein [Leptospira yasudae]TGL78177.1 TIGR04452 family lipoprotein [Leptospira yasudae]TGL80719.1 TIGR04452 family lipoprotein [Leptospira yasudae]TGL88960.1 TIGR04452 family lipoprotein [Leptospira yasudae]